MCDAKYITFIPHVGPVSAVVFHNTITHSEMRQMMRMQIEEVLGAGFVQVGDDGKPRCYGNSESLNVKARGEKDTKILWQTLNIK